MGNERIPRGKVRSLFRAIGGLNLTIEEPHTSSQAHEGNIRATATAQNNYRVYYYSDRIPVDISLEKAEAGEWVPYSEAEEMSVLALRDIDLLPVRAGRLDLNGRTELVLRPGTYSFGIFDFPNYIRRLCESHKLEGEAIDILLGSIAFQFESQYSDSRRVKPILRGVCRAIQGLDKEEQIAILREFDRESQEIMKSRLDIDTFERLREIRRRIAERRQVGRIPIDYTHSITKPHDNPQLWGRIGEYIGSTHSYPLRRYQDEASPWQEIVIRQLEDAQPNVVRNPTQNP